MSFRVMTYNILDDGIGREPLILEVVRAAQPDMVILQEVGRWGTVETLAAALHLNRGFARGNSKRHLAVLSRFPILECHSYHPWPLSTALLEAKIELAAHRSLLLFGVHLAAQPFVLFELWRWREITTILRRVRPYLSEPCVLTGDFNAIAPGDTANVAAWPKRLKQMWNVQGRRVFHWALAEVSEAGFTDCYRCLHPDDSGFTLPTPTPNSRLDYIFATDVLKHRLRHCIVVQEPPATEVASDHYPVVAEFDL
jgi:endonuclease/exonuclease/phosphatase family metal-dependent hydrolase